MFQERWAGHHMMDDGRVLRLEYTRVVYEGDGWEIPPEVEIFDEVVTVDCVKIAEEDFTDALEEDIEKARLVSFNIPYNFGPPD